MNGNTPRSLRLHIGIFGRRNAGKSSLLNAITRQEVSIVSPLAGTTTDPVEKPMELLPLGPVQFIDTAGLDDEGALGELRVAKTRRVFDRADIGVIVAAAGRWESFEQRLLEELATRQIPIVVAFNKCDQRRPDDELVKRLLALKLRVVCTSALEQDGAMELRQALLDVAPADFLGTDGIVGDIVGPGELAILVVPIDKEAPKGRIILPQVQTIRELLDIGAMCMVTREHELADALKRLNAPPKLVVTDSQAFEQVSAIVPPEVMLTGFSVLFSRFKGDLMTQMLGATAIEMLRPGDRVPVAEACSHHPIGDDIGRVKIPRWLAKRVGGELDFTYVQGHDFPADLASYRLAILCGSCMLNRREVLSRILRCQAAGVPVTNYGLLIAYCVGIFERALQPFPEVLAAYQRATAERAVMSIGVR